MISYAEIGACLFPDPKIIGTCSLCTGPVSEGRGMAGPICIKCGATAEANYGPVIQMRKAPEVWSACFTTTNRPPATWGQYGRKGGEK